jgi:hypothetical protein
VTGKPSSNITPLFLRYADLKKMGIVFNYPHLRRLKAIGFPQGKWLSSNVRVWLKSKIDAWVASMPTERPVLPEYAKRRDRKAAAAKAKPSATNSTPKRKRRGRR